MKENSTSSVMGRKLRLALAFVVVLAVMAPVAVIAAGGTFVDDDTSIFEGDIEWMAANGITSGCGPDTYCPEDNVTRGQMAAFMKRLATKKVVDAATAVTADSAATAEDAALLAGAAPAQYQTVVAGVACDGVTCVDGGLTNTELLELEITVPAAGYIALDGSFDVVLTNPSNEYVAGWMTLNGDASSFDGCEGSFLGIPLGANRVLGSASLSFLENPIAHAMSSVSPAIAVSAGTHTISLCDFATAATSTYSASLTAVWSASGSATPASAPAAMDASDVSPELVATLEAIANK